jgi:MraZ protein
MLGSGGGVGGFVGSFTHSLDPKRRLTIPSEWRTRTGDVHALYVLPDLHAPCLSVMPARDMMERMVRIRKHSMADPKARQVARTLGAQTELVTWDAQGRIRIKDDLLAFAQLKDRVVLVGAFDIFELWNPALLEKAGGMDREKMREAVQYIGL